MKTGNRDHNKGVGKPENINRSMEHGDGRLETEIITQEDENRRMKTGNGDHNKGVGKPENEDRKQLKFLFSDLY